jgi:hypothetical protein
MLKLVVVLLFMVFGMPQDRNSYKITENALEVLRARDVPQPVLKRLERIKNRSVFGESKFEEMLRETIGQDAATRYKEVILENTIDPLHESVEYGQPNVLTSCRPHG